MKNHVQIFKTMHRRWGIIRDGGIVLGKTESDFISRGCVEDYCKANNLIITNNPPNHMTPTNDNP